MEVVKGLSRRVVVVRFPDTRMFEQAIFILRDDAAKAGVSADDVVREACGVAGRYVRQPVHAERGRRLRVPVFCASLGAALTGLAWLLSVLFLR